MVHETAGTTRDAVDSVVEVGGRPIVRFVDTAGLSQADAAAGRGVLRDGPLAPGHRPQRRGDARRGRADGVTQEDKRILSRTEEAGRGIVAVANKWDLLAERGEGAAPGRGPRGPRGVPRACRSCGRRR